MVEYMTVDDSLLSTMLASSRVHEVMPDISLYQEQHQARGGNSGCPRCPHRAARNHDTLKALKSRLLSMTTSELQALKDIYHTKSFVFYLPGAGGYTKQVR